jgi:putative transposase
MARVVAVGYPHHVTQRGSRRQQIFFNDEDYLAYLDLMRQLCPKAGLEVWAYCLMPNHVHMIVVPHEADALRGGLAESHRRYARRVNFREGWRGHLWQERFGSFVLDEAHLWAAVRYVERNPMRAGLVEHAEEWPWSSARFHLGLAEEPLVQWSAALEQFGDWRRYLSQTDREEDLARFRRHERTGRPVGSDDFIKNLEAATGRSLKPGLPGRPRKSAEG